MKTKRVLSLLAFLSAFSGTTLLADISSLKDQLPQEVVDKYKKKFQMEESEAGSEISFSTLADETAKYFQNKIQGKLQNETQDNGIQNQKLSVALLDIAYKKEVEDLQGSKKAIQTAMEALSDLKKANGCVRIGDSTKCTQEHSSFFGKIERALSRHLLKTEQQIAWSKATTSCEGCGTSTCNPVTAFNSANPQPIIITTPGHYCIAQSLTLTAPIIIQSSNVELSLDLQVLDATNAAGGVAIFINGSTAEISNIQISGCGEITNASTAGILVTGATDVLIANTIFDTNAIGVEIADNCSFITIENIVARSGGYGVLTTASSTATQNADIRIVCSEFRGNSADAINITGVTDNLVIENCVIYSNEGDGIYAAADSLMDQILIQNCFIGSNGLGIELGFGCQNCLVQNVMIQDTKSDGILLSNASNVTFENCQLDSIQGRGFEVGYGSKNLHLKNCEVSNTTDSPFEAISVIDSIIEDCTFYTVADNQVAGMNLSRSDNFIIRNCLIRALLTDPTLAVDPYINLVTGTNGLTLQNCHGFIIEGNQIQTNAQTTNEIDGAGILLYGGNRDCVIRDCIIYNDPTAPASRGIAIIDSHMNAMNAGVTVENCTISGASRHGMFVQGLQDSIIQNTMISNTSQGTGLTIKVGDGLSILGNLVMHNGHHGIHLGKDAENCSVRDNTSYGNGKVGIKAHEHGSKSGSILSSSSKEATNAIYHNFAYSNAEKNFVGVPLVVHPKRHVGVLENISD